MTTNQALIRNLSFPAIDGIRFYAAFIVFVEHILSGIVIEYFGTPANQFNYKSESELLRFIYYLADGNHGVDIFFIISGFLMARIIAKNGFTYHRFVLSRLKRIYPAFLASLIITTAIVINIFGWPWKPIDFLYNLVFLNAFPNFGVMPYNHVSWSLGYEFAFYLVIPVLALITKAVPSWVAGASLLVASVLFIPDEFIRFNGLFAGAMIGSLSDQTLRAMANRIPALLAAAAFTACGLMKYMLEPSYLTYYWSMLACTAMLFIRLVWRGSWLGSLLASSPLRKLGTLSYSIYLYHSVIGSLVLHKLTPWPASIGGAIFSFALTFILTLAASYASYQIFERWYFRDTANDKQQGAASAQA